MIVNLGWPLKYMSAMFWFLVLFLKLLMLIPIPTKEIMYFCIMRGINLLPTISRPIQVPVKLSKPSKNKTYLLVGQGWQA